MNSVLNAGIPVELDIFLEGVLFGLLLASRAIAFREGLKGGILPSKFYRGVGREMVSRVICDSYKIPKLFFGDKDKRENVGKKLSVQRPN